MNSSHPRPDAALVALAGWTDPACLREIEARRAGGPALLCEAFSRGAHPAAPGIEGLDLLALRETEPLLYEDGVTLTNRLVAHALELTGALAPELLRTTDGADREPALRARLVYEEQEASTAVAAWLRVAARAPAARRLILCGRRVDALHAWAAGARGGEVAGVGRALAHRRLAVLRAAGAAVLVPPSTHAVPPGPVAALAPPWIATVEALEARLGIRFGIHVPRAGYSQDRPLGERPALGGRVPRAVVAVAAAGLLLAAFRARGDLLARTAVLRVCAAALRLLPDELSNARLLNAARPRLYVGGSENAVETILLFAQCRRRGVRTCLFFNGIKARGDLAFHFPVDRLVVQGEYHRQHFLDLGFHEDQLVALGSWNETSVLEARHVPPEPGRVTLFPSGWGVWGITRRTLERVSQALVDWLARRPDATLVLRPHRSFPELLRDWTRTFAGRARVEVQDAGAEDSFRAIARSSVVVTLISTCALEAVLVGRPLVLANFTASPSCLPFAAEGAALEARTPEDLGRALDRALDDAATREALARGREASIPRHMAYLDGRFYDRLAAELRDLLVDR
ncbi:MAG: hypothetical protein HYZ53_31155 [Planctomycetes bacterium]|nr:hypothetical protein [Planctomycetota bacterium]